MVWSLRWSPFLVVIVLSTEWGLAAEEGEHTAPGAKGYLTRGELDAIPFGKPALAVAIKPRKGEKAPNTDKLKAAVWMPRTTFLQGEALPAYFILRSQDDRPRSLRMRLDLFRGSTGSADGARI